MPDLTDNHGFEVNYLDGEAWDYNDEFQALEERVPVVDTEANRSTYTPHTDAQYIAYDTGEVFRGDGTSWVSLGTIHDRYTDSEAVSAVEGTANLNVGDTLISSGGNQRLRFSATLGDVPLQGYTIDGSREMWIGYDSDDQHWRIFDDINGNTLLRANVGGPINTPGTNLLERGNRVATRTWTESNFAPEIGSVNYATEFSGTTGGDQIQNALDDLGASPGTVVVPATGPDDLSGHTNSSHSTGWLLTSTLTVPPRTTLIFDGSYVFLDDAVASNILTNKLAHTTTTDRDTGIRLLGRGGAHLDGNAPAQGRNGAAEDVRYHYGIVLHNVENCEISGLRVGPTAAWAILVEDFENVHAHDLFIDQDNSENNQDGFSFAGPGTHGTVRNIAGYVNDDLLTAYAYLDHADSELLAGDGGDLERLSYDNATSIHETSNETGTGPMFRIYTQGGFAARNISASNLNCVGGGEIKIINNNDTGGTPAFGQVENISVSNVTIDHTHDVLRTWGPVNNISISNIAATRVEGSLWRVNTGLQGEVRNLTLSDCSVSGGGRLLSQTTESTAGGSLEQVTVENIRHENEGSVTETGAKILVDDGLWQDVTFKDITIQGNAEWDGIWLSAPLDADNVKFEDITLDTLTAGIGFDEDSNGSTTPPMHFNDVTFRNITNANWNMIGRTAVYNGRGWEDVTGTPTTANWHEGDIVETNGGLYMLLSDSQSWVQIG